MSDDNVKKTDCQLEELKKINGFMRLLIDSTNSIFMLLDRNAIVLYCSENILELLGTDDINEIVGKSVSEIRGVYDDQTYFERSVERYKRLLAGEDNFTEDDEIIWPMKGKRLYQITHKLVESEEEGVNGIALILRDVTNERIQEENQRIAERVQATQMACLVWDEIGNVVNCNKEALRLFGLPEYLPQNEFGRITAIQPKNQPDGRETEDIRRQLINDTLDNGYSTVEVTLNKTDGAPIPIEVIGVRISWQYGHRLFAYLRDLRAEKENERKIRESQEETRKLELQREKAIAASEAKSQFLASMSHEIRTPMNTIIGLLDLLRTDNLDAKQTSHINDIKRMSEVLLKIINDILDFHKIEAGKLELLPIHFNLYSFYIDMISRYKQMAESKLLNFKSNMAPDLPRAIFGDELRINQIITNLLTNAVKYTRKGYVDFNVDIAAEDEREYIVFTVEDSGIGIKREHFNTLFDEFEQFDSHKNRSVTGTGLGLPIAKRLADMMEGHIRFESEYGYGSVFTFSLPLKRGNIDKVEYTDEIECVMATPDVKVLVVDDNSGNITVAVGLLARHGIVPQTADNGKNAIEMIKINKYDLVFMDHMMPEMDGVEATAIIRKLDGEYYKKLPIVALSANVVAGAKELFYSAGMNDFVSKPIILKDLNRALQRWLPKEKIMVQALETVSADTSSDEIKLNKLLEELVKIKDLSVTDGLSKVNGDKELYAKVLWQFCKSADDDVKAIKKFAKKGMWNDYAIRVHGIKTVFANIGNQFMSDWAFSLEEAAMLGDTNKCLNETNYFCSILMQFYMKLLQTNLMTDMMSKANKTEITLENLKDKLEKLLIACDNFHADAAETISKELLDITFSTEIDEYLVEIHDLVHSYDYNEAGEIIRGLMQRLMTF